ncbi:Hypothetical predicted protein [Paramuricea clavata]|uniref:Uncharacterized protein n=1 Tax=Paramuricea clavata TaxID=317549 RepID=A0A6S7GNW3_PARCT|nr:Hypothetical predicted protein [Paramuricea clavata]
MGDTQCLPSLEEQIIYDLIHDPDAQIIKGRTREVNEINVINASLECNPEATEATNDSLRELISIKIPNPKPNEISPSNSPTTSNFLFKLTEIGTTKWTNTKELFSKAPPKTFSCPTIPRTRPRELLLPNLYQNRPKHQSPMVPVSYTKKEPRLDRTSRSGTSNNCLTITRSSVYQSEPHVIENPTHEISTRITRRKRRPYQNPVNKSVGPDYIPNTVLKEFAHELAPIIKDIYNQSMKEGYIPELLKSSIVIPVPKINPPRTIENDLRPISLTCTIAKVMEGFTCTRLLPQLEDKLDPRQYARKNHSTTDALLYTLQAIYEAVDIDHTLLIIPSYTN